LLIGKVNQAVNIIAGNSQTADSNVLQPYNNTYTYASAKITMAEGTVNFNHSTNQ